MIAWQTILFVLNLRIAIDIGETADSESVDGETVAEDEKKPVRRRRATQKDVQDDVG